VLKAALAVTMPNEEDAGKDVLQRRQGATNVL
jgi:hypothetical protein